MEWISVMCVVKYGRVVDVLPSASGDIKQEHFNRRVNEVPKTIPLSNGNRMKVD